MKNKKKTIPPRNYLILALLFLTAILTTLYIFKWQSVKIEEQVSESYLIKTNTVSLVLNTLEELEVSLLEVPEEYFIFTGYTGNVDEYELEEDLKEIIDDYHLSDKFYYLNITDLIEDENLIDDLEELLSTSINGLPAIIYVSNDQVANKLTSSEDEMFDADDFEKLLEIYDFIKSN